MIEKFLPEIDCDEKFSAEYDFRVLCLRTLTTWDPDRFVTHMHVILRKSRSQPSSEEKLSREPGSQGIHERKQEKMEKND